MICGIATLTPLDLAASKLLANSDGQADDGVFSRDDIDLAMMNLPLPLLRHALVKAEQAYGLAVTRDLGKAIDRLQNRSGWLKRCMQAMAINAVKALLWQKFAVCGKYGLRRRLVRTWELEFDPVYFCLLISAIPA